MIISGAFLLVCPILTLAASARFNPHSLNALGSQAVNLWRLRTTATTESGLLNQGSDHPDVQVSDSEKQSLFTPQWFTQPLDHFSAECGHTFLQRFWVNTRHYRPGVGGPVYVLDGGETSGEDRLPFLDTGIMEILAKATGGVSVVLEHRYYGMRHPTDRVPIRISRTTQSRREVDSGQQLHHGLNAVWWFRDPTVLARSLTIKP